MTRQNRRRPLLIISGGLAACGAGSASVLLGGRGAETMTQIGLPPDVIADAGYATIAAGSLAFVVQVLSWLLRLFQEQKAKSLRLAQDREAFRKMLDNASTFEEYKKTYLILRGSGGDHDSLGSGDGDGDSGPEAGQSPDLTASIACAPT